MDLQQAAHVQAVLEGVPLPAVKQELVSYARDNDGGVASLLESLPDREYESLDDVGEALVPVQPLPVEAVSKTPHPESGKPPGGDSYTDPEPDTGRVREGTEEERPTRAGRRAAHAAGSPCSAGRAPTGSLP